MTRYTIVGAGAIGGTIGAYMARDGIPVTFVDSVPEHVEAIRTTGLRIKGFDEDFTVQTASCLPNEMESGLERVILAVKAQATEAALDFIAPKLAPDGCVISAQNGLNEIQIADRIGAERTIGCFVNFSADYIEPGLIHFGGPGAFYIGELDGSLSSRLQEIQQDLSSWGGGGVRMTDNIWGFLWGKLAYGAALFATALCNQSMADAIDQYRPLMIALSRQVIDIARAENVELQGFDGFEPATIADGNENEIHAMLDRLVAVRRRDQKKNTGVWRDLAVRKRKTEAEDHFMPIVRLASKHNLPAHLIETLIRMIGEIEAGQRPLTRENLEEFQQVVIQKERSGE